MNKRMTVIGATTAVLVGLLVSTGNLSARPFGMGMDDYGQHGGYGHRDAGFGMRGRHGIMRALSQLELSEEQEAELREIMEEKRDDVRDRMRSKREARAALREAMSAEPFDAAQVQQLAEEQGRALTDMILDRAETTQRIRALLTPEQRAELADLRSKTPCRKTAN